jgi:hypothetical protein
MILGLTEIKFTVSGLELQWISTVLTEIKFVVAAGGMILHCGVTVLLLSAEA